MDLHYKQEVTVGVLVLAGVGLFLGGTMWLKGARFARGEHEVRIAFQDVGTLKKGSPVRISGVNLGAVDKIDFEDVGKVVIAVRLDPKIKPKIDAVAKLASVGLVGDAVINFLPGTSTEPLPPGKIIQGTVEQGIMDIGNELGGQAKQVLTGLNDVEFKKLSENLNATLNAFQRFVSIYADPKKGPTAEITATMQSLQKLSARLDTTLAQVDLGRTLRHSDSLIATFSTTGATFSVTGARLDTLLQKINRGDGTLGKLANDTLLYSDFRRVAGALEKLVDELRKHPGKITIQVKAF
jgi:phospholipid/cholesterol/gamma-HCH transport system substrate-binding protein